jgi:site-specific DNA-adenine methylase
MKTIDRIPLSCPGNKYNEYKRYLKDYIDKIEINDDTIFIEPFCGSCYISFNLWKEGKIKRFHINDLDNFRIEFYNNINDDKKLKELYDIENEIREGGEKVYYKYVDRNKGENRNYCSYIISRRIFGFRYGLFPTTKTIKENLISDNWKSFFKSAEITNKDWLEIMNKYKDDPKAIVYLDPPYLDSYNSHYTRYKMTSIDDDKNIIDYTKTYADILDYLKTSKCKIVFSINSNALSEIVYKDFIKEKYDKIYGLTGKKESVLLISN